MSILHQAQSELKSTPAVQTFEFAPKALEKLILSDLGLNSSEVKIDFLVGTTWKGYGQAEHQVPTFHGVRVAVTKKVAE